jgi:recombination protein RecA
LLRAELLTRVLRGRAPKKAFVKQIKKRKAKKMAVKAKALPPVVKIEDDEEKKKAVDAAIAMLDKQYGAGTVMRLGQSKTLDIDCIPTGSMTLDLALGIGGMPRGRITEIFGPESGGKTTVSLHVVAEAQKLGGTAAFIDVEHALDPIYARSLGVDTENLLVSQPDSGEQALEITEALIRSGAVDIIVLDSVAAMVTKAEIDGLMGDAHVGQLARLMSGAMRKLTSVISRTNCVAIFINQVREKIGISYGSPETTPGGRALKFYASTRIEVRKGETLKDNKNEAYGNRTKCKVVKNKVAPPFKECEFDMIYGKGISRTGEVLDLAVQLDVVKKSGSWFSYGSEKLGQGRDAVKTLLENDKDLSSKIEEQVMDKLKKGETVKITKEKKSDSNNEFLITDNIVIDENIDEFEPLL